MPTGKSFQSNAAKFPHPKLHIAVNPKAERYMFLLQLQLYVLTVIRVTLRRRHQPLGESPHFVSLNIPFLVKAGYKESQFYKFTVIVANKPYTNQLYLQKSTWFLFTSVYFDTTVF